MAAVLAHVLPLAAAIPLIALHVTVSPVVERTDALTPILTVTAMSEILTPC